MRVLLATDGKPGSLGAVRMAVALEREAGAEVKVLRTVQPLPVYGPASSPLHVMPVAPAIEEASRAAEAETDRLLASVGPAAERWPARLEVGPAPVVIVRTAEHDEASLIVLGLGRHERVDRWFGTETALRVVQLSYVPVLAVPADARERRPRRAVVAVDFSDFSRAALQEAVRACGPGSEIHVVHVLSVPDELVLVAGLKTGPEYHERVVNDLRDWVGSTALDHEVELAFHSLEGKIADRILELAGEIDADVIAGGTHGMGFFARLVLGSVTTRLLRSANRAVLIVPPREKDREVEGDR